MESVPPHDSSPPTPIMGEGGGTFCEHGTDFPFRRRSQPKALDEWAIKIGRKKRENLGPSFLLLSPFLLQSDVFARGRERILRGEEEEKPS